MQSFRNGGVTSSNMFARGGISIRADRSIWIHEYNAAI
jgi:hypothetical protein